MSNDPGVFEVMHTLRADRTEHAALGIPGRRRPGW